MKWLDYLLVGVGSAMGGMIRFGVSGAIAQRFPVVFPFGTLVVNVTGSFLIGFIASISAVESRFMLSPTTRNFLMAGIMGGYTTFSSFSLQTLNLARDGQWLYSGVNIAGSVVLCLVGVWLGHVAGQLLG